MDGPRNSPRESAAPDLAWIGAEDDVGHRVAGRTRWPFWVLAPILVVVAAVAWEVTREPDWPSGCDVSGHVDWCSAPSESMTDPAMIELAHAYCPALSRSARGDVSPQPLSQLGLADDRTFAKTTGGRDRGSEDALLGTPAAVAWVTRWQDGRVDVRCVGSSSTTPSLGLRADQFRSTVTAGDAEDSPRVAFTDVARDMMGGLSTDPPADTSFGFLTCDTGAIDLERPEVGETFTCAVQVFGLQGEGRYRESYRIAGEHPFFEPVAEPAPGA